MESSNTQPETRNPQQEVGGGLQPDSPTLQPLENQNSPELNPNQLPETNDLRVTERDSTTGTIQVPDLPGGIPVPGGGTSLWVFSAVSLILALILLAMAKVAKPAESVKSVGENKDAIKGAVQKDKIIAANVTDDKLKTKKKIKKNTKKKKRR